LAAGTARRRNFTSEKFEHPEPPRALTPQQADVRIFEQAMEFAVNYLHDTLRLMTPTGTTAR
jgi:hypothetical protein